MIDNHKKLKEMILDLSISAQVLTDQLDNLQKEKNQFLTKAGNRKLWKAYKKSRKAAVLLMEIPFDVKLKAESVWKDEQNQLPRIEEEKLQKDEPQEEEN